MVSIDPRLIRHQQFVAMQWHVYFTKILSFAKLLRRPTAEASESLFIKVNL